MQERQLKEYDNNLNRQMDLTSIIERWERKTIPVIIFFYDCFFPFWQGDDEGRSDRNDRYDSNNDLF